jgi:hypothetical protein
MFLFTFLFAIALILSPAPKIDTSITHADLEGSWGVSWGGFKQDMHFDQDNGLYGSERCGGGIYRISREGLITFNERSFEYQMLLRKDGNDLIGWGGSRGDEKLTVWVVMKRRIN